MAVVVSKRLFKASEAAEYLSISRAKIYDLVRRKKVPSILVDGCRLFDVLDLDKFVERTKTSQAAGDSKTFN